MGFTPINTQEELDAAIGDRLKREREKYSGYLSPEAEKEKYNGYLSPQAAEEKYGNYLSPEAAEEKYKDYLSPEAAEEKYKDYLSPEEAAKKDKQIRDYETNSAKMRIAQKMGIPIELADRISGETEEEIEKDAKLLSSLVRGRRSGPLKDLEEGTDDKKAGYRELLNRVKGS